MPGVKWRDYRKESDRKYYEAHRDERRESRRKWRDANLEKAKAASRASNRRWYEGNHGRKSARDARRRSRKAQATPLWSETTAIAEMYMLAFDLGRHVDHVVPLVSEHVCGLHVLANLQILTGEANRSKGNRHWPDMW